MKNVIETSKYYKFRPVDIQILKELFTYENESLAGCNIYQSVEKENDLYAWVRVYDLSYFDLVEAKLDATEISLEEINRIQADFPLYQVRKDIP
jgi:hypothetical protein